MDFIYLLHNRPKHNLHKIVGTITIKNNIGINIFKYNCVYLTILN